MITNDPTSLQKRRQRFVIDFERHKTILKVAIANFESLHFSAFNLVMNLFMVLHAHLKNIKNGAFDIFY